MSAYMALVHADRVELVSDGATYLPDGTMVMFNCKIHPSEYVPAAVTSRGRLMTTRPMQEEILEDLSEGSFDDAMGELRDRLDFMRRAGGADPCELAVAGISESLGPVIMWATTVPVHERAAFVLHESKTAVYDGVPCGEAIAMKARGTGGLRRLAPPFMQKMRMEVKDGPPEWDPGSTAKCVVGGHLDMATVTRAGVKIDRIHTWSEDKIGEKIKPFAIKPDVSSMIPAGLNRAQRRQAEKMIRRELAA